MAEIGWLVSPIVKEMVSRARSYLESQYNWSSRMKNDLKRLETITAEVLAVVSAAERRRITDPNQAALLRLMKEAVYEAEDVMDEFDCLLLKAKEKSRSKGMRIKSSLREAGQRLLGLNTFQNNLLKICESLERVNSCAKRFLDVAQLENNLQQPNSMRSRLTSSFSPEVTFIGRYKEREEIVKALLDPGRNKEREEIVKDLLDPGNMEDESGSDIAPPIIVPIVGVAGVGKTTLAQHIYNDKKLAAKFEIKMWVCVSDNFDMFRLSKEILEASSSKDDVHLNLNKLQDMLRKRLSDKKFLLVLDDVWNDPKANESENCNWWMKLLAPLRIGERGSAILVTTQIGLMAKMLLDLDLYRMEKKPCYLKGLERSEGWLLFKTHAFASRSIGTPHIEKLKQIGMEIVEKLKDSPLALRVVGRQLNGNYDVEEWEKVLRSALSDDIMKVLKWSFERLPEHLQRCLAYCSLFPRDWHLERGYLVHMWRAQGFIYPQDENNTVEDIGRDYFKDLCNRSFFHALKDDGKTYYVMHSMLNDLALSVSRGEYCRIESNDQGNIPPTVRHLSITTKQAHRLESMVEMKNLRTLIVFNPSHGKYFSKVAPKDDMLENLKSVRVLVLTGYCMKQLPSVNNLIHLRYLALQRTSESLLDELCSLYHLQALDIHSDNCLKEQYVIFPKRNKFINMQHVYFNEVTAELHVQKKNGNKLGVLKDMHGLHGKIRIKFLENIGSKEEACEARLSHKEHINTLSLEWSSSDRMSCEHEAEVLDSLQPHQNLSSLAIKCYGGSIPPFWMGTNWLCKLKSLYLSSCKQWKELPPLGHLPFLKILHMESMHALTCVDLKFYGVEEVKGFPALEDLRFEDMPEWVEWNGLRGTQLFSSLHRLSISKCPKLMKMPAFPLSVVKRISISPNHAIEFQGLQLNSISILTIMHPDNIKAVEELEITQCNEDMPAKGLRGLISLKNLEIRRCPRLLSSMNREDDDENVADLFPQSLESLHIQDCKTASNKLSRCIRSLTALSYMEICNLDIELPWELDLHYLTGLVKLDIGSCKNLTALMGVNALTSLRQLYIWDCLDLLSLPSELSFLPLLKDLWVARCREIRSLPEHSLPLSLESATISKCHPILQEQLHKKEGSEFDKFYRFRQLKEDEHRRVYVKFQKLECSYELGNPLLE